MKAGSGQGPASGPRPAADDEACRVSGELDWRVLPDVLRSRIDMLRLRDGRRAWSFESIGARVGYTGAAIRKIVSGQTRQPDLTIVDGLAKLLSLPPTAFTTGRLPYAPAADIATDQVHEPDRNDRLGNVRRDEVAWLGDSLLAAMERIVDPDTRQAIETVISPHVERSAAAPIAHPIHDSPWRLDPRRLHDAIARAGLPNTAVAAAVQVSEGAVRKMRRGHIRRPNLATVQRLATLLNVSVADLTTGDIPHLSRFEDESPPCRWLSNDARAGLAELADPVARAAVKRGIRLVVESAAVRRMKASNGSPTPTL
jgi:transcriptional regulator with XRE-family HTH domain